MERHPKYEYERALARERGYHSFCGVDEVGRGPLAGPVYAAAVVLPEEMIEGLDDSKKLSAQKREALCATIRARADYCVASASVEEIEALGIAPATFLAMRRAVDGLRSKPEGALVDGNKLPGLDIPAVCVVKGDGKCASIAAASILAKVARDRYMSEEIAPQYPQYGFEQHKGYGTALHMEKLRQYDSCPVHRESFLKNFRKERRSAQRTSRGGTGEDIALRYLERKGFALVERNAHNLYGETDLIVQNGRFLVFAEVKLRTDDHFSTAAEAVDRHKQRKLWQSAELWLSEHPTELQPRFDVIEVYLPVGGKRPHVVHIEHVMPEMP